MAEPLQIGRYVLYDEIASGGMAKVHLGKASGALGFSRIVAIKRILPHLLGQQEFVEMFVDETRVAARIQHPNVVSTIDAIVTQDEVFLVMEYVLGESVARLLRVARKRQLTVDPAIAIAIAVGALRGLHAAHDARNDNGDLLGVVHRDVSPQNLLVGVDGVTRVIDFGVAKARGRLQTTREGQIKGKLAYMSPEQLASGEPDRRTDIYAVGVILWEALAGRRLHQGDNDAIVYASVLHGAVPPPSHFAPHVPPVLDAIVMRAIARDPSSRFVSAEEMLLSLEAAMHPASPSAVGAWVRSLAGDLVDAKATRIAEIEKGLYVSPTPLSLMVHETGSMPSQIASSPSRASASGASAAAFGRSMTGHEARPQGMTGVQIATIVLAILGGLMAAAIAIVFVRKSPATTAGKKPAASMTAASVPVVMSPPAPAPVIVDESRPPQEAGAIAPAVAAVASSAPPPSKPTAVAKPAAPPHRSCDPPWFIDNKGIKRFKPECM